METGDHAPKPEDISLPDDEEIEDEIKPEDVPLPPDDPYETSSYNSNYNDFLDKFKKYEIEEYKGKSPSLETLRNNTLSNLKSMRVDIYKNLYDKYLSNDVEK